MYENVVSEKAMRFAIRMVRLYQYMKTEQKEYVLSRQLLRSGTSIGANVAEAEAAITRRDFLNKMYIAFKECSETLYWLELLHRTDYLTAPQYQSLKTDCIELRRILSSITKTTRDTV